MIGQDEFGASYAAAQIAKSRHPVRRFVKQFYVGRVVRRVRGKAVDLGCGAAQILRRLPPGSMGIEINPCLVEQLRAEGLNVQAAVPSESGFDLSNVPAGEFSTLVLSHVLEHCVDAGAVLKKLLKDCHRLGIGTVIVVVPTIRGYHSDATHKTYIDAAYLKAHGLEQCGPFRLAEQSYFPWNSPRFGNLFIYHEMMLVYEARP